MQKEEGLWQFVDNQANVWEETTHASGFGPLYSGTVSQEERLMFCNGLTLFDIRRPIVFLIV